MEGEKSLIGRSFLRNAYFGYGAQAAKVGIGFAWIVVLTAVAGLEVIGMYALLTSMSGLFGSLLTFRTNEAVVKFYKRGVSEGSLRLVKLALLAGLALDVLIAISLFSIVQLLAEPISRVLLKDPGTAGAVALFSWVVLANYIRGTGMGLLTASERFKTIYSIAVVEALARLVVLFLVWTYSLEINIDTVVAIVMMPALITSAVVLSLPIGKVIRIGREVKVAMQEVREYLSFSLNTFISSGLKVGHKGVDNMILGFLASPESVGIYHLFKRFLRPLMIIVTPFYAQIYPVFVAAMSNDESAQILPTINRANTAIVRWSIWVLAAIIVAISVYWMMLELPFTLENILTFAVVAMTTLIFQRLWWTRGFALSYRPSISIWANLLHSLLVIGLGLTFTWWFGLFGISAAMFVVGLCMTVFWHAAMSAFSKRSL